MIVITEAKTVVCEQDFMQTHICGPYDPIRITNYPTGTEDVVSAHYMRELIQGKRIRHRNGQETVIGVSKEVQDILDIPMDLIDNHRNEIAALEQKIKIKNEKIIKSEEQKQELLKANFATRLLWVFDGVSFLKINW